jgi:hypothetical protein
MVGVIKGQKINNRKFPGIKGRRPDRKEQKVYDAEQRQKDWESLTPTQQLKAIDLRLGKNVGATKQRARIQKLVDKGVDTSVAKKTSEKKEKVKAKDRRKTQKNS